MAAIPASSHLAGDDPVLLVPAHTRERVFALLATAPSACPEHGVPNMKHRRCVTHTHGNVLSCPACHHAFCTLSAARVDLLVFRAKSSLSRNFVQAGEVDVRCTTSLWGSDQGFFWLRLY